MTDASAYLRVNRLVVRRGEDVAYDERFHTGLNIIRGNNSSGKSTILDFIFYVLGGDLTVWKAEAAKCTHVMAEISANGTLLTLRRQIREESKTPMDIFFGSFEDAAAHTFQKWEHHPYASTAKLDGFSKVLYRALGYPEVKSDLGSTLSTFPYV